MDDIILFLRPNVF